MGWDGRDLKGHPDPTTKRSLPVLGEEAHRASTAWECCLESRGQYSMVFMGFLLSAVTLNGISSSHELQPKGFQTTRSTNSAAAVSSSGTVYFLSAVSNAVYRYNGGKKMQNLNKQSTNCPLSVFNYSNASGNGYWEQPVEKGMDFFLTNHCLLHSCLVGIAPQCCASALLCKDIVNGLLALTTRPYFDHRITEWPGLIRTAITI